MRLLILLLGATVFKRAVSLLTIFFFVAGYVFSPVAVQAQSVLNLPLPGSMVTLSQGYVPSMIKGLTIDPTNPLQFDFIIDSGNQQFIGGDIKEESEKLIKYFLAALTVPEDDMWVNLSPYEKDRIIADGFGVTEMGRDMLAQDYLLKQLTSSLMYPEEDLGKEFWERVRALAFEKFGSSEVPMNTFNKIWIVPDKAVVFEHGVTAFVVESRLKVMLDTDYVALTKSQGAEDDQPQDDVTTEILREVLLPEIEKEVNEGTTFANLRQMYQSMILATWYKLNLKNSLLGRIYVDQNKVKGVDTQDKEIKQKIYNQYIEAFKVGVYNYIKEEYNPATQELIPRKYFSGGVTAGDMAMLVNLQAMKDPAMLTGAQRSSFSPVGVYYYIKAGMIENLAGQTDGAMLINTNSDDRTSVEPVIEDQAMLVVSGAEKLAALRVYAKGLNEFYQETLAEMRVEFEEFEKNPEANIALLTSIGQKSLTIFEKMRQGETSKDRLVRALAAILGNGGFTTFDGIVIPTDWEIPNGIGAVNVNCQIAAMTKDVSDFNKVKEFLYAKRNDNIFDLLDRMTQIDVARLLTGEFGVEALDPRVFVPVELNLGMYTSWMSDLAQQKPLSTSDSVSALLNDKGRMVASLFEKGAINKPLADFGRVFVATHDLGYSMLVDDETQKEPLINTWQMIGTEVLGLDADDAIQRAQEIYELMLAHKDNDFLSRVIFHGTAGIVLIKQHLLDAGFSEDEATGFALLMASHHAGHPVDYVAKNLLSKDGMHIPNKLLPVLFVTEETYDSQHGNADQLRRQIADRAASLLNISKGEARVMAAFSYALARSMVDFVPSHDGLQLNDGEISKQYGLAANELINFSRPLTIDTVFARSDHYMEREVWFPMASVQNLKQDLAPEQQAVLENVKIAIVEQSHARAERLVGLQSEALQYSQTVDGFSGNIKDVDVDIELLNQEIQRVSESSQVYQQASYLLSVLTLLKMKAQNVQAASLQVDKAMLVSSQEEDFESLRKYASELKVFYQENLVAMRTDFELFEQNPQENVELLQSIGKKAAAIISKMREGDVSDDRLVKALATMLGKGGFNTDDGQVISTDWEIVNGSMGRIQSNSQMAVMTKQSSFYEQIKIELYAQRNDNILDLLDRMTKVEAVSLLKSADGLQVIDPRKNALELAASLDVGKDEAMLHLFDGENFNNLRVYAKEYKDFYEENLALMKRDYEIARHNPSEHIDLLRSIRQRSLDIVAKGREGLTSKDRFVSALASMVIKGGFAPFVGEEKISTDWEITSGIGKVSTFIDIALSNEGFPLLDEIGSVLDHERNKNIIDLFELMITTDSLRTLKGSTEEATIEVIDPRPNTLQLVEQVGAETDAAMLNSQEVGGIDFNSNLLDLQINRDGAGIPLPLEDQSMDSMNIEGFFPLIIDITPINSLPLLLGIAEDELNPLEISSI